jgi:hypothetical protein
MARSTCLVVFWIALVLWISSLVSAAVAAMNVFPTLSPERLPLRLDAYPDFPVEEHPRLAAGVIMNGVFATVDVIQLIAIPVVLVTLGLQVTVFRARRRTWSNAVRVIAVALATAGFAWHATQLAPTMNRSLRAFWQAAEAGDVEAAAAHRAEFNRLHPSADAILRLELILLLVGVAASAVAVSPPADRPRLETPELAAS